MKLEDKIYLALYNNTKVLAVALGYRDPLTQLHSERVLQLAVAIGVCCGLTEKELGVLKIGASFHDVGKIGIPDQILQKPGSLDGAELEKMRKHTEIGEKIMIANELEGSREAGLIIRQHHENFNGSGYPDGLSGEDISIGARIISIADSYDAMAVTRAYHRARTHQEIMDILEQETGEKHDPEVMRKFCEIIESSEFKAAGISAPD